ncbi:MAG: hypothetical protein QG667_2723, partial [Pseudomonadota bacterium]|nr:hypothetical protein [Pseudomonadota bacterium]
MAATHLAQRGLIGSLSGLMLIGASSLSDLSDRRE